MHTLALKVPPLAQIIIAIALVYAISQLSIAPFRFALTDTLSGLFLLAGAIVAFMGLRQFRLAKTSTNPLNPNKASSLVTSGIYQYTRNPMYLGMVLVLIGAIIEFASLLGFIVLPLFISYMTQFQIKPEERIVESLFGEEYVEYKQRVRRWI
ncbi:methyltransferase family protein [Flavobacterium sp. W21_SRS_FM6]|uniref:methyltransferase family protein n=1 Tax=Flavobacterium sp. W21_SRS_FM6 TaxID=3240268 RepID=UPI003F90CFEA